MRATLLLPKLRFVLVCILSLIILRSIFITSKILFDNYLKQLYSSYGLSDEGFLLGLLTVRSQENNVEDYVWPFTEVLRIPFEVSGGDIVRYRLIGVSIIVALFCYFTFVTMKAKLDRFIFTWSTTVTFLVFSTFPTPFNFLLVTPGYQWVIIVSSTFITLLTIFRVNLLRLNKIDISLINFFIICSILARPTSGAVILLCLGAYSSSQMKIFLKRFLVPQIFVLVAVISLNLMNLRDRFIELSLFVRIVDANGYNLSREILDIGKPFLFLALTIIMSFLVSSKVMNTVTLGKYQNYLIGISMVIVVFLLIFDLSKNQLMYLSVFFTITLGCLSFFVFEKIETALKFFLLSFIPFFAQFGSNIQSLANPIYIYLSLSLFFVSLLFHLEKTDHYTEFKSNLQLGIIFILFLNSAVYINYAKQVNNTTYEKSVGETAIAKSNSNELMYNELQLQKLDNFRNQADLNGQKVTDLSFWHPGLILFAGGHTDGWSLPDEYFSESIDQQIQFLIERNDYKMFSKNSLILLESGEPEELSSICRPIVGYILSASLSEALLDNGLNTLVQVVAVYESSPEDANLYPNFAVLVKVC